MNLAEHYLASLSRSIFSLPSFKPRGFMISKSQDPDEPPTSPPPSPTVPRPPAIPFFPGLPSDDLPDLPSPPRSPWCGGGLEDDDAGSADASFTSDYTAESTETDFSFHAPPCFFPSPHSRGLGLGIAGVPPYHFLGPGDAKQSGDDVFRLESGLRRGGGFGNEDDDDDGGDSERSFGGHILSSIPECDSWDEIADEILCQDAEDCLHHPEHGRSQTPTTDDASWSATINSDLKRTLSLPKDASRGAARRSFLNRADGDPTALPNATCRSRSASYPPSSSSSPFRYPAGSRRSSGSGPEVQTWPHIVGRVVSSNRGHKRWMM